MRCKSRVHLQWNVVHTLRFLSYDDLAGASRRSAKCHCRRFDSRLGFVSHFVQCTSLLVLEPIPSSQIKPTSSVNQKLAVAERPRPKGNNTDAFIRTMSLRSDNPNQIPIGEFKRQGSLKPSDLPSIQESKYNFSITNTSKQNGVVVFQRSTAPSIASVSEEVEPTVATNELFRLSLIDSTNTYSKSIALQRQHLHILS